MQTFGRKESAAGTVQSVDLGDGVGGPAAAEGQPEKTVRSGSGKVKSDSALS